MEAKVNITVILVTLLINHYVYADDFNAVLQLPNFSIVNIDKDKETEIIYGSSAGSIHVLKKAYGKYREIWSSILLQAPIVSILVNDIDNDQEKEIIAGTSKGEVYIYSSKTFTKKWDNIQENLGSLNGVVIDDLEDDGRKELIIYNSTSIIILEGGSYFRKWKSEDGMGAQSLVIGNVDQDYKKEIITNTGFVIDTDFFQIKWTHERGFGEYMYLFDIDSDGMLEIISEDNQRFITVFDIDLKSARIR